MFKQKCEERNVGWMFKMFRKVSKPVEEAVTDYATDIAADVSTKAGQKVAEKSIERSIETFFAVPAKLCKESGKLFSEATARSGYLLKGGLKIEFQIAKQRRAKRIAELKQQRHQTLKTLTLKKS